ncbi:hypothetical protein QP271_25470, partial [Escherichia coli]|nr:hypothetical protein [Escherichia coli]
GTYRLRSFLLGAIIEGFGRGFGFGVLALAPSSLADGSVADSPLPVAIDDAESEADAPAFSAPVLFAVSLPAPLPVLTVAPGMAAGEGCAG